jgi:hypothetical protein
MHTIEVYNVLKDWMVDEKRSPFVGVHHSGIVQIPKGEFTDEQMKNWVAEGVLELVESREVEDNANAGSLPGVGAKKVVMKADTGNLGAEGSSASLEAK